MSGVPDEDVPQGEARGPPHRSRLAIAATIGAALLFAAYLLFSVEGGGAVSLTFTFLVPAVVCALLAFALDRTGERSLGYYLAIPFVSYLPVILIAAILLGEGVICILMLAPLWLCGGIVGAVLVYALKSHGEDGGPTYAAGFLLLPLLAAQLEAALPVPAEWHEVSRAVLIDAPRERVWPLLVSIPAVRPGEGRWNATQDLFGVPRPREALLGRRGGELVRTARWGASLRFEERIAAIEPGRSISWRFAFPDESVRLHTDAHIAPDGPHLLIHSGGYRLEPASGGRTRLVLTTRYRVRTTLNFYAAFWGERLLGDIQDNVLAIVRQRAEAAPAGAPAVRSVRR